MYQNPNHRLLHQTCIVTGANSGIGKGVALAMGRDCANVIVNYVNGTTLFVDGAMTCYPGFTTNG